MTHNPIEPQQVNNLRLTDLIEIYFQDCKYRGLSEKTIKDYDDHLKRIFNKFPNGTSKSELKAFVLSEVQRGLSPSSANHYIRSIKAFYSFMVEEGLIDTNPFEKLSLVKEPISIKNVLSPSQISRLIAVIPESGYFNLRDKALITLAWDTAIRAKELLTLTIDNVDLLNNTIKVHGKGRRDRVVPFGRKTKKLLIQFMKIRKDNGSPLLFCTESGQQINHHNFHRTLNRYGAKIALHLNPHLIRHSAASFLAKSEMPAQHLQVMLGHTSLNTTQRYINQIVNQEGLQISHRRLSPGDRI